NNTDEQQRAEPQAAAPSRALLSVLLVDLLREQAAGCAGQCFLEIAILAEDRNTSIRIAAEDHLAAEAANFDLALIVRQQECLAIVGAREYSRVAQFNFSACATPVDAPAEDPAAICRCANHGIWLSAPVRRSSSKFFVVNDKG